ncbi:MAG: peptide-methionine (S)-S-oxide reductase [Acidobacteria bacterium]|nr:MAG: peptide-methionine (S)-S-oxide reductase [Acidobacteriota bacterium]REK08721.1 MAG: peptide-methionine (S)-S-oxide reductase [Acidobacteriota bacterium]
MKHSPTHAPTRALPRTLALCAAVLVACAPGAAGSAAANGGAPAVAEDAADLEGLSVATFASGCFWCVEAVFESVEGVREAISGYAGGRQENPTYEQVARGRTDHAEAVQVYYDPEVVDFESLVDVFFGSQNPVQVDGQGPDRGRQYRSILFYTNDEERRIAEAAKQELAASYDRPIAAEIVRLEKFWEAEEYHQDYERKNPNNPYIRGVSIPRLKRFQAKFPELLKKDGEEH